MTAATLDRPADLSQLLDGDACCEIMLRNQPECGQPASWLVTVACPHGTYTWEGSTCQYHRDMIKGGYTLCRCGAVVQLTRERPI